MKIISSRNDIFSLLSDDGGKFGVESLEDSYLFCKNVTNKHYENFPVGSIIVPSSHRNYFYSVYTFSRLADDIADELTEDTADIKVNALIKLSSLIKEFSPKFGKLNNPLLWALSDTINKKKLSFEPFEKLIKAFIMDSEFVQPVTMQDNIDYCRYSANPVGEIVLRLFDNYNDTTAPLSDSICTGLQLVNFWQDISEDIKKNRIYLPVEILQKYDIDEKSLFCNPPQDKLDACLQEIYDYTEKFFIFGKDLVKHIENKRLKYEVAITNDSGLRILQKVRKSGNSIIHSKPKLSKIDFMMILIRIFFYRNELH
jgi:squalene synthase HpnC